MNPSIVALLLVAFGSARAASPLRLAPGAASASPPILLTPAEAQPEPGVDFYGLSIAYRWTTSPRGAPLDVNFSAAPASGLSADDGAPLPPAPSRVTVAPPFRASVLVGTCTLPPPLNDFPSDDAHYGAHVWLANFLYSEQLAWPVDGALVCAIPRPHHRHPRIPTYYNPPPPPLPL